jgi:hypothetical protein
MSSSEIMFGAIKDPPHPTSQLAKKLYSPLVAVSASNDSTLDRFDQFFCMIPVTATTHAPDAIHGTKALQRMSTDLGVVSCLPTGLGMLGIGAFDTAFWIVDPTNVAPSKRCRHHDEDGEE